VVVLAMAAERGTDRGIGADMARLLLPVATPELGLDCGENAEVGLESDVLENMVSLADMGVSGDPDLVLCCPANGRRGGAKLALLFLADVVEYAYGWTLVAALCRIFGGVRPEAARVLVVM
jgi:hypothetical protein